MRRTQVAIIGGGPSGLLLAKLLQRENIESVILERSSREHVLGRIRAGVLETGFVDLLRTAGVADRLDKESFTHSGVVIAYDNAELRIDFNSLTNRNVVVYGQTEVTRDLYAAHDAAQTTIHHQVEDVVISDAENCPQVSFHKDGRRIHINCDFVAGCDGFHGISRATIPASIRREYQKTYPFGWLGVLSRTPPVHHELIYASSLHGFALCSMRNENLSRYYIQCQLGDEPADWRDDDFWSELRRRIPQSYADKLVTGAAIEKSIAPLRSFVCEPMQWGKLFLCGDAAHIVPPTGAKGLNTAASDVYYLYHALMEHYLENSDASLKNYSRQALKRVWKAERFSWWMTQLLHRFANQDTFEQRIRAAEFALLADSKAAQKVLAENYVGLPY